jgi:hypothetical protein
VPIYAKQQHVPAYELVTIPPTWPFACWGLDMIGPLPTVPGGFNRVLVAIDKFTKWIEVKPVTYPKADRVLDFLDELVHRYELPHRIITDWAPTSTITSSGSSARTAGSTSDMSQFPSTGQWTSQACQWDGTRRSQKAAAWCC